MNLDPITPIRDNPQFIRALLIFIGIEAIVTALFITQQLTFDNKAGIAAILGLPAVFLTLIQLHSNNVIQRAGLVKDLAAKLYTDNDLSESFHVLIYSYSDSKYLEYKTADKKKRATLNAGKSIGLRFYDPSDTAEFCGSLEERRLDSILGYLDIIAYHYHRNLIQMNDIAGVLGYQLATIASRQAITDYRESIPGFWNGSKIGITHGTSATPLRYLDEMLTAYNKYCKDQNRPK